MLLFLAANISYAAIGPASQMRFAIRWRVLNNGLVASSLSQSNLTLANTGQNALPKSGWALYFNFDQDIDPLPQASTVRLTHINGDFFRLEPTSLFLPMGPGAKITIPLNYSFPIINNL
jgi:hexosaminidase